MTLSVTYKVVRVSSQDAQVLVTLPNGSSTLAAIPAVEVEMIAADSPTSGTIKLGFTGPDMELARKNFTTDATVVVPWGELPNS